MTLEECALDHGDRECWPRVGDKVDHQLVRKNLKAAAINATQERSLFSVLLLRVWSRVLRVWLCRVFGQSERQCSKACLFSFHDFSWQFTIYSWKRFYPTVGILERYKRLTVITYSWKKDKALKQVGRNPASDGGKVAWIYQWDQLYLHWFACLILIVCRKMFFYFLCQARRSTSQLWKPRRCLLWPKKTLRGGS